MLLLNKANCIQNYLKNFVTHKKKHSEKVFPRVSDRIVLKGLKFVEIVVFVKECKFCRFFSYSKNNEFVLADRLDHKGLKLKLQAQTHTNMARRPFPNFFRKKKNRERKKLSRCFGFSFFFPVPNIFYRYRTIENFYIFTREK